MVWRGCWSAFPLYVWCSGCASVACVTTRSGWLRADDSFCTAVLRCCALPACATAPCGVSPADINTTQSSAPPSKCSVYCTTADRIESFRVAFSPHSSHASRSCRSALLPAMVAVGAGGAPSAVGREEGPSTAGSYAGSDAARVDCAASSASISALDCSAAGPLGCVILAKDEATTAT